MCFVADIRCKCYGGDVIVGENFNDIVLWSNVECTDTHGRPLNQTVCRLTDIKIQWSELCGYHGNEISC